MVPPPQLMVDGPPPASAPASVAATIHSSQEPVRSLGVFTSPTGLAGVQVGSGLVAVLRLLHYGRSSAQCPALRAVAPSKMLKSTYPLLVASA